MAEATALRVPPHSIEAEQAVLGALLLDNAAWDRVGDLLEVIDFYRADHGVVFSAIGRLVVACRPADVLTVHEALRAEGKGDLVTMGYLNDMACSVPSAASARHYAEIVRQRSMCRRVISAADMLVGGVYSSTRLDGDLPGLVDRAVVELLALLQSGSDGRKEPQQLGDLMGAWIDALQDRASGISTAVPTGLAALDRLMAGGLWPGDLIVIGARPSMGKSALSLTIARNVARWHGPVAVLSMEDSAQMLVSRQVAAAGRINLADLRNPAKAPDSMWGAVAAAADELKDLPLYVDDDACLALADVRRKALQVKQKAGGKLSLVIIDYLQLMEDEGETRASVLAGISRGLKRLAKELGVPVVLLSQLSREADKVPGPPRLDHLRESGAIEEAADVVGLLWREARRNPKPDNKHKAQLELAKHKNGATDTVHLWFDGATQRFADLEVA